jgi:hypothetical protein
MPAVRLPRVALLALPALLLAPGPAGAAKLTIGDPFPLVRRGDLSAHLAVHVDRGPQPGEAAVEYEVVVVGGMAMEVEPPQLSDPLAAWDAARWTVEDLRDDDRRAWVQRLELTQTKSGPAPLPDVKVRFRAGPSADSQEVEWTDILKAMRGPPPPEPPPPPPESWTKYLPWAAAGGGAAALLAAGWFLTRRRSGPGKPLPPDRWALRELARVERTAPPAGPPEAFHTLLSNVVRRYVAERFGLPAPRQTTAEFLESVRRSGKLSAEHQALLRDFLGRCDLSKFARVGGSPEECRETAALARAFVQQTAAPAPRPAPTA